MLLPEFAWRHAGRFFEDPAEVIRVLVAYLITNLLKVQLISGDQPLRFVNLAV